MSYITSVNNFLASWQYESESTVKVFDNLTDSSLKQKVTEEGRSLGFIAWHITQTIGEMMSKTGLKFENFDEHALMPNNVGDIKNEYVRLSSSLEKQIKGTWKDEMLEDDLNMYGQIWKRGAVLASLLAHQTHHRGQMTVLMRQAGLKVPGIYGPSKEEWTKFGMAEQP